MRSRGTLFWGSLFLTLLLLLPIIGVVQFLSAQRARQERVRQANAAASSVTVEPGAQLTATVLVVVQQEDPGFVLGRLDAPAAALTRRFVPRASIACCCCGVLMALPPLPSSLLPSCFSPIRLRRFVPFGSPPAFFPDSKQAGD